MSVYFFLFWLFFLMLYEIVMGFFDHLKDGFWGYHDRITASLKQHTEEQSLYGQEDMLVRALDKQRQELEGIMGQYVFFRFCERISLFLTQVDTVLMFCVTLATVVFLHSAWLNREYLWMLLWALAYGYYMWQEISGTFNKFEVWATNLFLKQYKELNRTGAAQNILEAKKSNKQVLKKLYFFVTLPAAGLALATLLVFVIYPLMPPMPSALQGKILLTWLAFVAPGAAIVVAIPVLLDKFMNARIKARWEQFTEAQYAVYIYLFLSLLLSTVIEVAKFSI